MTLSFKDVLSPSSPYWEKCARHQNMVTTRNIAHFFLCDDCAKRLTVECFNERPPIYNGLELNGYCGLCNEWREIGLRQWFIDPICLNVVLSYPKSIAACKMVVRNWQDMVNPIYPNLLLEEIDVVKMEPYILHNRASATKQSAIDFRVKDVNAADKPIVFFIELKTGPSSLSGGQAMREFQLDVNDYEDIVKVMRAEGKPAYVFHAQVVEEYHLPSKRSIGKALWWTDIFTLRDNLKYVKQRRGEDKKAGYYDPKAFKPIEQFQVELANKGYEALNSRLKSEGIANLPS